MAESGLRHGRSMNGRRSRLGLSSFAASADGHRAPKQDMTLRPGSVLSRPDTLDAQILTKLTTCGYETIGTDDETFMVSPREEPVQGLPIPRVQLKRMSLMSIETIT
jgi:hypothetical protein